MAERALQGSGDREVIAIYEVSKVLASSLDLATTVRGALGILESHLEMHRGRVWIVHEDGGVHPLGAHAACAGDGQERAFDRRLAARVLAAGSPLALADAAADEVFGPEPVPRDLEGVALLAVPVKCRGAVSGVLAVCRKPGAERRIHFDRDLRILSLVGQLIGQALLLHQAVATERRKLIEEKQRLQKQLQGPYDIENVIGRSAAMKAVFADVQQSARGHATILLRGESGTGKEAIANAIHYLGPRAKGPFVKVNCAALSETLLESELFGHEKGAFTGAVAERQGRFEQARGGTLFLDEIGDISPAFQAKLLRVLQEREFERVGGNRTIKADVRLVCATNRDLEDMVRKGDFRADLYFRINVVTIALPPLRERKEDIPLLADFFLARFNRENGRDLTLDSRALELLGRCNWPGNVRELENCIERTATMARGGSLQHADLRCGRGQCFSSMIMEGLHARPLEPPPPASAPAEGPAEGGEPADAASARERLVETLERCGWVQAKAARMLGMTPRQVGYALRKLNIPLKRL